MIKPGSWLLGVTLGGAVFGSGLPDPAVGQELMTAQEVVALDSPPGELKIAYGEDPLQFGHLRLPAGAGPHPVVVFIHGGCWLSDYDIGHVGPLEQAFTEMGYAVWSIEYRRVGNEGGGWPGTFRDVALGADYLLVLAEEHNLNLESIVTSGHSAGGHLALWLADRGKIPTESDLYTPNPLAVDGVFVLAPAPNLERLHAIGVCEDVVDRLMGGSPTARAERYAAGSPMQLAPLSVPAVLFVGAHDETWGPGGAEYYQRTIERGSQDVKLLVAPASGHFEMIVPTTPTWKLVEEAFRDFTKGLGWSPPANQTR